MGSELTCMVGLKNGHICKSPTPKVSLSDEAGNTEEEEDCYFGPVLTTSLLKMHLYTAVLANCHVICAGCQIQEFSSS